jgi:thymidylate synthase (FAD)
MIVGNGHHAIIEHVIASVRVVTNRGVSLELVRHRLCSVAQESSRYCNYGRKDMEFIRPVWWDCDDSEYTIMAQNRFLKSCQSAEYDYRYLLDCGWRPEQAREVLPNSLKTELVMTANLREWLHIFSLRTSERAHPQMRALMRSIQEGFRSDLPEVYGL